MLKIRLCGCCVFFNQAGKSKSLRQRWHGLTFFNPDLPRLGTSSSLTVIGPVSNFKTETQSARRRNVFCPTIQLTIFHWWPRAFCSVKSLQWNINLKIKINFRYYQKIFSGLLAVQYLIKIELFR